MSYGLGIGIFKTTQSFKMCTKVLKPVLGTRHQQTIWNTGSNKICYSSKKLKIDKKYNENKQGKYNQMARQKLSTYGFR